jgi:hypothetical protein
LPAPTFIERKFLGRLQSALASNSQPACLVVSLEAPRRSRRLGEVNSAAHDCRFTRRAKSNGLVEKSYFLDFFEAFLAVFFVLFLAVFFFAAM